MLISITDDGMGHLTEAPSADAKIGIGLENTRARLDRLYPQRYRLEISYPREGGCIVGIELPCDAPMLTDHESPQLQST